MGYPPQADTPTARVLLPVAIRPRRPAYVPFPQETGHTAGLLWYGTARRISPPEPLSGVPGAQAVWAVEARGRRFYNPPGHLRHQAPA